MNEEIVNPPERKSRRRFNRQQKAEWVRRFVESGLTQFDFCRQHALSGSCLQRWLSRDRAGHLIGGESSSTPPTTLFTELSLPAPAGGLPWAAELCRPNGTVLRVARELSPNLLELLLRAC